MPSIEREYSPTDQPPEVKADRFFGALLRSNPDALKDINFRNQHILLSYSDSVAPSAFSELGSSFGIAQFTVKEIYINNLIQVWDKAPRQIKEQFPLSEIFKSQNLKMRRSARNVQANHQKSLKINLDTVLSLTDFLDSYATDPEFRDAVGLYDKENKRASAQSSKSPSGRRRGSKTAVIRSDDLDLWTYATDNNLITAISSRGSMTPEEINILTQYFEQNIYHDKIENLLNKFSILVARLA